IKEAYELLKPELSIDYKVNFGVSETEIKEFLDEEEALISESQSDKRGEFNNLSYYLDQWKEIERDNLKYGSLQTRVPEKNLEEIKKIYQA
ncbi:761_t:CDS:2, partial [Racocetra persica]